MSADIQGTGASTSEMPAIGAGRAEPSALCFIVRVSVVGTTKSRSAG